MNTLKKFSLLLMCVVVFTACKNDAPEIKTVETASSETTETNSKDLAYSKATFEIEGMTCEMGCARTIEKRLAKMDGVKQAKVNFEEKNAIVEFDEAKLNTEKIEQAVTKVSEVYSVHNMQTVDSFEAKTDSNEKE